MFRGVPAVFRVLQTPEHGLVLGTSKMPRASPLKSLSVREDSEGKRSFHVKSGENAYKSVANFHFKIVGFVNFPQELHIFNGYLLDVHRSDGENM